MVRPFIHSSRAADPATQAGGADVSCAHAKHRRCVVAYGALTSRLNGTGIPDKR